MPSNCTTVMLCDTGGNEREIESFYIIILHLLKQYSRRWISLQYNKSVLVLPHFTSATFLIHAWRSSITRYIIDYEFFFFFPLFFMYNAI